MLLTEIGSTSLPEFMNTDEDASEHTLHNQERNRCALIDCVGMQIKTVNDLGGFCQNFTSKFIEQWGFLEKDMNGMNEFHPKFSVKNRGTVL